MGHPLWMTASLFQLPIGFGSPSVWVNAFCLWIPELDQSQWITLCVGQINTHLTRHALQIFHVAPLAGQPAELAKQRRGVMIHMLGSPPQGAGR